MKEMEPRQRSGGGGSAFRRLAQRDFSRGWMAALSGFLLGCSQAAIAPGAATPPGHGREDTIPSSPIERATAASGVFLLDGQPLCFAGANNYYLTYKSQAMVDDLFHTASEMGVRVLRHWAFNDTGSLDGSVPSVHRDGIKDGHYLQYWDNRSGKPAYNDGKTGLEKLDYLLFQARQHDIRIVMVLTNNWRDFGGMDQYLSWYGSPSHPGFYTDERVKKAYKDYVAHLVNRVNTFTGIAYKDDPYIFAWGLANEPRMRNFQSFDTKGWEPTAITDWAQEMSDFIRDIDANHLISVGDEGFYTGRTGPLYAGEDGVDHEALIALRNIDYTTFHLYPDHWRQTVAWGERWIEDHLTSARRVGKPAVLEEYNLAVTRDEGTLAITSGAERRARGLERWHAVAQRRGAAGAMFWMLAGYDFDARSYYKDYDHFSVYSPDVDVTGESMRQFAARMRTGAQSCEVALQDGRLRQPKRDVPPGFVTTSIPDVVLAINGPLPASQRTSQTPR